MRFTFFWYVSVFFFQAEDGIRAYKVTGVQTCALPISFQTVAPATGGYLWEVRANFDGDCDPLFSTPREFFVGIDCTESARSEERRVGNECRSRRPQDEYVKRMMR